VLLNPLLEPGSAAVVFDTLSYSAGPLPEQLLREVSCPVEVVYGLDDPWTPAARVEKLATLDGETRGWGAVKKVTALKGVGHCPHDEAPELVNPLVVDFVKRIAEARG
jgi:pimeloyl-ACP methyl ester carboxylesterase